MLEHVSWILGECLKMGLHIREQEIEIFSLMIMRDHPSRDAPEPRECRLASDHRQGYRPGTTAPSTKVAQATYQEGTSGSVSLEVVGNHDSHTSATCGAGNRGTHLFTEHISGASRSDLAIKPAIAPVHQVGGKLIPQVSLDEIFDG